MKYPPRNIARNETEKQPVFSPKLMGEIRIKLKQLAEIEYLHHTKKMKKSK